MIHFVSTSNRLSSLEPERIRSAYSKDDVPRPKDRGNVLVFCSVDLWFKDAAHLLIDKNNYASNTQLVLFVSVTTLENEG